MLLDGCFCMFLSVSEFGPFTLLPKFCVVCMRRQKSKLSQGEVCSSSAYGAAEESQQDHQLVIELTDSEDELPVASSQDHSQRGHSDAEEARQMLDTVSFTALGFA